MKPLISVVVPVYNVEKYLAKCVESILNCEFGEIELLLVDDGSTDSSGRICDGFSEKDSRIRVLHKTNAGVSAARKTGLDASSGKYITFIDSDDYVHPLYLTALYEAAENTGADIATCGYYYIWKDGRQKRSIRLDENDEVKTLSGDASVSEMLLGRLCALSCASKLYKRELFEKVEFPSYKMGEDTDIVIQLFLSADKAAHINKTLYFYYQHSASVTHSPEGIKFYDYIRLYDKYISGSYPMSSELKAALRLRLVETNFWILMKLRGKRKQYPSEVAHIFDNIKKYRGAVIADKNTSARVKSACLVSYGGLHLLNAVYCLSSKVDSRRRIK